MQANIHTIGKFKLTAIAAMITCSLLVAESAIAEVLALKQSALVQLEVLHQEKSSRTLAQTKINSSLLFAVKKNRRDPVMAQLPDLRTHVAADSDGLVEVDIRAEVTDALLQEIENLGGKVINSHPRYDAIRANLPLASLESLAEVQIVKSIRPADQMYINKENTSEGDVAHAANTARSTFSVDGTGVKVGVISDSVDQRFALQASGDLPPFEILFGQSGGFGSSEGTAMLEIVYDLAPGADLIFATANGGQAQFAQNIIDLAAEGASIIVDDIGYFAEAVFQDGIVASAVNQVTADGVLYFSSAGNSGNLNDGTAGVWQGDFHGVPGPPEFPPSILNDFGGGFIGNPILASGLVYTLHWSDPQGGSSNDYDLILVNSTLDSILAISDGPQTGSQDPFEAIAGGDDVGNYLVIQQWADEFNPPGEDRFMHLNTNRGILAFATDGQTSGHSAAANAFSVAAVNVLAANNGTFTGGPANPVELFSSDGPRKIFFHEDGTPVSPGDFLSTGGLLRQKPDITAADGVSTATDGFDTFFGTSASAPHAAAIAALLKQKHPEMTPAWLDWTFTNSALDIEAPGIDRDSGVGIIMADTGLAVPAPPAPPNVFCSSPGIAIEDGVINTDTMNIVAPGNVVDIAVTLDIDHTWVSDVEVTLDRNGGSSIALALEPGGTFCSDDDINVTLWDGAATSIDNDAACGAGTPVIKGTYAPSEALGTFDGQPLTSDWTISVTDNGFSNTGTLNRWCILVNSLGSCDGQVVDYTGPGVAPASELTCNVGIGTFSGFDVDGDMTINGVDEVGFNGPFAVGAGGTLEINMPTP